MQTAGIQLTSVDRTCYAQLIDGFLPARVVDLHAHIWLKTFERTDVNEQRGAQWASAVASQNSLDDLLADYAALLPGKQVTPMVFGWPGRHIDLARNNAWVSQQAARYQFPSLYVSVPEMPPAEMEAQVAAGGFKGLKPYLDFAPRHLSSDQITVYDFLPPAQLEVANAHGWIIMLHIPRSGRLKDPLNLAQITEIERKYPQIQLIIAHLGRAYCEEDLGDAIDILRHTDRMLFDFSANTNQAVMLAFMRAMDSQRLVFGSDLPITHMRMRRICERGSYINLVPPGLFGNLEDDPHMREVSPQAASEITFFIYEEIVAFLRAAQQAGWTEANIEAVFYRNAQRILQTGGEG